MTLKPEFSSVITKNSAKLGSLALVLAIGFASAILNGGFWPAASATAVVLTLWWIIQYTKESSRLADLQQQQLILDQRPVLSLYYDRRVPPPSWTFEFFTVVHNFSMVHAKVRIKVKAWIEGVGPVEFLQHHPYSGSLDRVWALQAAGNTGLAFRGSLGLLDLLSYHGITDGQMSDKRAWLRVDMWVVNSHDPDSLLMIEENHNPTCYWKWRTDIYGWEQLVARPSRFDFELQLADYVEFTADYPG